MIAWADDNTVNEIPGIRGSCGDGMDDAAGRDRDGDAGLYFTQDADPDTVGLGDAAAGDGKRDRHHFSPRIGFFVV